MLKHGLKLVTFRISSSIPVYEGGMLCCLTLGEYRILEKAIVGVEVSKEKDVIFLFHILEFYPCSLK